MEKEIRYRLTFSYKGKRLNIFTDNRSWKREKYAEKIAGCFAGYVDNLRIEKIRVKKK